MPLWSTARSDRGKSVRDIGVMAPRSIRPIRSRVPLDLPLTSNGVWLARIVQIVAAREKTSLRTSGWGSSSNISGGDHGTDIPTDCPVALVAVSLMASVTVMVCMGRASSSSADEMPKSVSAGQP